ncbi:hypothetical protein EYV94_15525 [Puteibacter caeruleilacunae]|nr:hypothetical protein EYV94_15525 [Puteibacter caeruleilacunae]
MKRIILLFTIAIISSAQCFAAKPIQPWKKNHWYWSYKGKPIMLLGASSDDNLFQWPGEMLVAHLDSMKNVGANYVRNTMSDRHDRGFELYPFLQLTNGKYDLDKWNPEYWNRFEFFLKETTKRNIVVQIEIWDRFDYFRHYWENHPYNPKNNINYSKKESALKEKYPDHPAGNKQPFFFTTPKQRNIITLLSVQQRFVEKMLSISLKYDHVLYCMDNETSAEVEWAFYWADFVRAYAAKRSKVVCVTEMWDNWNLRTDEHRRTFDHPERFAYCDVSQNNQKKGQTHWDNFQWVKQYISSAPRPLNTVKTYGADGGRHGNTQDGIERWWRHVLGGVASARFHRPSSGLGLSELSIACVKIARYIEKKEKFWNLHPCDELLINKQPNVAYIISNNKDVIVMFSPKGEKTNIDLKEFPFKMKIEWIDISSGLIKERITIEGGDILKLQAPDTGSWIALFYK